MTKEEFVIVYKEMVKVELEKSDSTERDQQYHEIRCMAFWLVYTQLHPMEAKEMAEMVVCGGFPTLENKEDLEEVLEGEFELYQDDNDHLQDLRNHIAEYFGNK